MNNTDRATHDFLYSEAIRSDQFPEIASKIHLTEIDRFKFFLLCTLILQPARDYIGQPIRITSGKCSHELNVALGRNHFTTDHAWIVDIQRCAIDFQVLTEDMKNIDPRKTLECFLWITENLKNVVGQLIYYSEKGHIHVSLPTQKHYRNVLVKIKGKYVSFDSYEEMQLFPHANFERL
jgi:hypothetical protein